MIEETFPLMRADSLSSPATSLQFLSIVNSSVTFFRFRSPMAIRTEGCAIKIEIELAMPIASRVPEGRA